MLPAVVLFPRRCVSQCPHTLSTKRFTLIAVSLQVCSMPVRWGNNFIKKKKGGKKFFLGGRKNTLLQFLVCALACANCKSAFFVRWYFIVCPK